MNYHPVSVGVYYDIWSLYY